MKKVVRMLGLCALVALAFTSCKKNETNATVTFNASVTLPESNDRTYITFGNNLGWSAGDSITVFNASKENYNFTISSFEANGNKPDQNATFEVNDAEKVAWLTNIETPNSYGAFYPKAQFNSADNTVSITIPQTQYHDPIYGHGGSFDAETYPMYGVNDAANHFQFFSHAGVLELYFGRLADRTVIVKSITITGANDDDELVGTMVYPFDYPFTAYTNGYDENYVYGVTEPKNQVVFDCRGGIELTEPGPTGQPTYIRFDIALLRGALQNGFNVLVVGDRDKNGVIEEGVVLLDEDVDGVEVYSGNIINAQMITKMSGRILPDVDGDHPIQ